MKAKMTSWKSSHRDVRGVRKIAKAVLIAHDDAELLARAGVCHLFDLNGHVISER